LQRAFGNAAPITYGRWHHKPVGPHPDFSIQLEYPHDLFADVMAFLAVRRNGLTIFTHPNTGEDRASELRDHRDHAIWMGVVRPLKLSLFGGEDQT
jgi:aromatic ring-cleaving dioxygenase